MATHLYFLLRATFKDCNRKYKAKKALKKAKEIKVNQEDEKEVTDDFSVLHPKPVLLKVIMAELATLPAGDGLVSCHFSVNQASLLDGFTLAPYLFESSQLPELLAQPPGTAGKLRLEGFGWACDGIVDHMQGTDICLNRISLKG